VLSLSCACCEPPLGWSSCSLGGPVGVPSYLSILPCFTWFAVGEAAFRGYCDAFPVAPWVFVLDLGRTTPSSIAGVPDTLRAWSAWSAWPPYQLLYSSDCRAVKSSAVALERWRCNVTTIRIAPFTSPSAMLSFSLPEPKHGLDKALPFALMTPGSLHCFWSRVKKRFQFSGFIC